MTPFLLTETVILAPLAALALAAVVASLRAARTDGYRRIPRR